MDDQNDVERLLDRNRPASPPMSLRGRVLARAKTDRRATTFRRAVGLAACIAALSLHIAASQVFEDITGRAAEHAASERQAAIEAMTAALGGGDLAREAATRWLREVETRPEPAERTRVTDVEATWFQR
jgi:hypothetical protein